jgi:hypothetical protein
MANIQTTRVALQPRYVSNCQVHLEKTDGTKSVLQLPAFVRFDLLGWMLRSLSQTEAENIHKITYKIS